MDRASQIAGLKSGDFDLLVIGGGATGAGVALDSVTRGLKTALVEKKDFSSGTSSKSTKLIHGGVRYLEQAVLKFDSSQFYLVRDALRERAILLKIAPHLAHALPILTPLYNRIDVPYYRTGLKLYDRLAGRSALHKSYFVGPKEALQKFPMLRAENLRGGVVYYDGQFDDARMNVALALTAKAHGAAIGNYIAVTELMHHKTKVIGAKVEDQISGEKWEIRAKVVVNATGPYCDAIRKLDSKTNRPILSASSGTHIVVGKKFSPPSTGLLIPKTEDGRVLFLLPWLDHTVIGTTDNPCRIVEDPHPTQSDVKYILRQLDRYFSVQLKEKDILSKWTGLRPLVSDPKANDTARLSRDHIIQTSPSGLITITGGKWTTYRKMAEDVVNEAVRMVGKVLIGPCCTAELPLQGAKGFDENGWKTLQEKFGVSEETAKHVNSSFGTLGTDCLASTAKKPETLHVSSFLTDSEVRYICRHEMAETIEDILARRTRLLFLNTKVAMAIAPKIAEIMAEERKWTSKEKESRLKEFGKNSFA